MSATVVDELVTLLGFDMKSGTGAVISKFGQGIENISAKATGAAVALVAASAAVGYFVEKSNSATAELYKLKDLTGMSAKALQDWGYAADQAGGSAHDIQHDILGLEKALHPTMPGEYNEGLFQLLGPTYLQKYKNAKEVLLAVSEAIKGMPKGLALNYLAMARISESSYHLLSKGKAGVDQLLGKGMPFALSDAQIEKAFKFDQAMKQVYTIIKNVGAAISADLAPYLTKVLTQFEKWLEFNRTIINSKLAEFMEGVGLGFKKFGTLVQNVWTYIKDLIPKLKDLVENLSVKEFASDAAYLGLTALAISLLLIYGRVGLVSGAILGLIKLFKQLDETKPQDKGWLGAIKTLIDDTGKLGDTIAKAFKPLTDFFKPIIDFLSVEPETLKPATLLDSKGRTSQEASRQGDGTWLRDTFKGLFDIYRFMHNATKIANPIWNVESGGTTNSSSSTTSATNSSSSTTSATNNVTVNVSNPDHTGPAVRSIITQFGLQALNP